MKPQLVLVIALGPLAVPPVLASPPEEEIAELRATVADLQRRLEAVPALRDEIDALRAATDRSWLTEQRAEEIRGLVHDVLADADTRASLLENGVAAGWDKGFFLASADGNFRLKVGGQIQQRFVYNSQEESPSDDHRSGFEVRRAKLLFSGHVVDPTWQFDVQLAADRSSGNVALEDAGWLQKDLGDGWKVRLGQMKAPFLREEVLSSQRMFLVERSLMNAQFTAGTVQGVQLGWENDRFRLAGMYHDGNRTANTSWSAEDTEYAFSARGEWLAQGEFKNCLDYDSFKDEGAGVLIGAAANYSMQEFGTSTNNAEVENLGLTADATIEFGGATLAGAVVYCNLQSDASALDADQLAFLVRGGVFVTDDLQVYAQYEWGDLDIDGVEDLNVITVGASRYWARHSLKWQTDVGFGLDPIAQEWASDGAGWRTDAADEDGQLVIRSQFQLLF